MKYWCGMWFSASPYDITNNLESILLAFIYVYQYGYIIMWSTLFWQFGSISNDVGTF